MGSRCARCSEVEDEFEARRLLNRQVSGDDAPDDLVDVGGRTPPLGGKVDAVGHQPADFDEL